MIEESLILHGLFFPDLLIKFGKKYKICLLYKQFQIGFLGVVGKRISVQT